MKFQRKHGMARTRLYRIWRSMKKRCSLPSHPKYEDYGGRGIAVCQEWMTFAAFAAWALENGYSDDLSIDRKDGNRGYVPDNCRWSTPAEQAHNRRDNQNITFQGRTQPLRVWARELAIPRSTVQFWMKKGMAGEEALRKGLQRCA